MSAAQKAVLAQLARTRYLTAVGLASRIDRSVAVAQHILDGLYRRSLVEPTSNGRWCLTDRGRKKAAA